MRTEADVKRRKVLNKENFGLDKKTLERNNVINNKSIDKIVEDKDYQYSCITESLLTLLKFFILNLGRKDIKQIDEILKFCRKRIDE